MDVSKEIQIYAQKISERSRKREYSGLEPIMAEIVQGESRLDILAGLAKRLPGMALQEFFLCGLPHLTNLKSEDFKTLFALSSAHEIAIYNLTRFLIEHGRASKKTLQALCENFSEIEKIAQFHSYLEGSSLQVNEGRMNQIYYKELRVAPECLAKFREQLANEE